MKIAICSDLHLEFQPLGPEFFLNREQADILIISGDFAEIKNYLTYHEVLWALEEVYEEIYIIPGNHEAYHSSIEHVDAMFDDYNGFFKRVYFGNKMLFERNGILFLGTTLWTNFNRLDSIAMNAARYMMNDYHLIDCKGNRMQPKDTVEMFHDQFKFLQESVEITDYDKVVIFTHHAPTGKSITGRYVGNDLNAAYFSELSEFILDNPKIKLWVHGHIRDKVDYMVGDHSRVVSNPRGYPPNYLEMEQFMNYAPMVIEV